MYVYRRVVLMHNNPLNSWAFHRRHQNGIYICLFYRVQFLQKSILSGYKLKQLCFITMLGKRLCLGVLIICYVDKRSILGSNKSSVCLTPSTPDGISGNIVAEVLVLFRSITDESVIAITDEYNCTR